jgi:hypothetical protein
MRAALHPTRDEARESGPISWVHPGQEKMHVTASIEQVLREGER